MSCGSWSVLDLEEGTERAVEMVGVGDNGRDCWNDEDLERGDEGVDGIVWGKLVTELFDT